MHDDISGVTTAVPVCAIGASAGGIEALIQFFQALPVDLGLAYVVVVHLAPDHKSELPTILARRTSMPVVQVGDQGATPLQPDHVYVIAPDRKLIITDTSVGAEPFARPRGHRMAIDLLFRSLAEARGDGFAIIFSGTGSDGAVGAKAVKGHGGLVLVQDPDEAVYAEMPRAAIATGVADVILPVRQLAAKLAQLAHHRAQMHVPLEPASASVPDAIEEERALRAIYVLLHKSTGHDFTRYKRSTLLRRLSRRMQLAGQVSIRDYLEFLRTHLSEVQTLFGDLLISVTSFFRDADAWAALATQVIGPLLERIDPDEQVRVWVPGCSTGEEAYTVAMLFHEEAERRKIALNHLLIFATDVDEKSLAAAREGLFPQAIAVDLTESRLERFFRQENGQFRVMSELRDRIVFASHDLLRDPPFSRLSLISCRNLLIYLERGLQDQVMGLFRYALRDQGYLFLGASEAVDEDLFTTLDSRHRIFTARAFSAARRVPLPELLTSSGPRTIRYGRDMAPPGRSTALELHLAALEQSAPPSVLIDERGNVVHLSTSVARYFQQGGGPPARRLTDLVRSELRDELNGLINRAMDDLEPHLSAFVPVEFDGAAHVVSMLAQRRAATHELRDQVLVSFLDGGVVSSDATPLSREPSNELVQELREKLRQAEQRFESMREEHFSINEDLRAANEELQSLNEEYRSTTEELETSKEELQSVNEELQTVNNELNLKLEEVSRAHSDLENLMAATDVATLFLDSNLRIKRFTPKLGDIFNVKPRDYERPIGDLTHNLDYNDFEHDARSVLENSKSIEREARSRDGRTFVARLSPYRLAVGHDVDGVVITFVDITAIKTAESALRASEARLEAELDLVRGLHRMSADATTATSTQEALNHILETAVEVQHADYGAVQLIEPDTNELKIVAQRGLGPECLELLRKFARDALTSFGRALRTHERIQIPDVNQDEQLAPCHEIARCCGYRAVQATPLISRAGVVLGVLSVHFREPRVFLLRDTQLADLLGRQAADLIESRTKPERIAQLATLQSAAQLAQDTPVPNAHPSGQEPAD